MKKRLKFGVIPGFRKVQNVKVIPVTLKIVVIFSLFILISNLTSNYINLSFTQANQLVSSKQLLIKDLKELYNFSNLQYEISKLNNNNNNKGTYKNIGKKCRFELKNKSSVFLGINPEGKISFFVSGLLKNFYGIDNNSMSLMNSNLAKGKEEDFIILKINNIKHFGIYKYNPKWNMFLFRGDEYSTFFKESKKNFQTIVFIIFLITTASTVTGIFFVRYILRFIGIITNSVMKMSKKQQLSTIPLVDAPNDDVTYMGMAFNALSNNIDNLVKIFVKFADRDVASKAYKDKIIKLEGEQKELTVLFMDIKGYTFISETLGADIIKVLNILYDRAIRKIYNHNGIIASIIGDALLAVYGIKLSDKQGNKSFEALLSAFELVEAAGQFREKITKKKDRIIQKKGILTPEEDIVYKALQVEVGVGIDGGDVFYGTIGSYLRMTSTVIGDRVNAASRLEGLTRIYNIPVICSDYVKNDIEKNVEDYGFVFINIDKVQVKGKTEAFPIFWPVPSRNYDNDLKKKLKIFKKALEHYYRGEWRRASNLFNKCSLPVAEEFKIRTAGHCPPDWKGIWILKSK